MGLPLISVIVPVYNVEKYLKRCVDSIISQTYTNLEIILVDDGSNDRCPDICDEYVAKDSRIRVIHQKNGGLSAARNTGLDNMHGKYVIFVDSDDYIAHDMIEKSVECIEGNNLSAVIFEAWIVNEVGETIGERFHIVDEFSIVDSKEVLKMIITDRIGSQIWKGVYLSYCWHDVRFPVGRLYEDLAVTYKAYSNMVAPVGFMPEKLYYYRMNSNGISFGKQHSFVRAYHIFLAFKDCYEYALNKLNDEISDLCLFNTVKSSFCVIHDGVADARGFLRTNMCRIFKNKICPLKMKFKAVLWGYFPILLKVIRVVKKRWDNGGSN